ncbi:MAG: leucine--tRNA ligase [Candidatus Nanohaloarchaea archaeon]
MPKDFAEKLSSIEEKWQERWREEKLFEAEPDEDKEKFFITAAYPYPSGGMHVGHVRTYTFPDVFARFKKMQGYNVLFPMAWHVTGTPIIGALDRLKEGEEKQWKVLTNTYNVPEEVLEEMEKPMDFAEYFIENSYKKNMRNLGIGIDWRRDFTTNDKTYNKLIEWQYKRLKEKGLVSEGLHPTKYDLKSENPVTDHDLLEGEDAEKQEYSLVKFEGEDYIFPMATLRPETVFGVTHTLVNPEVEYVTATVDGEKWVVSEEAAEKLEHQDREVEITGTVEGEELVGEEVRNPVTGDRVIFLPATFVDPDSGSGLVMSVPAHAPYDWISLKDIQQDENTLREYGLDPERVREIEPVKIINVEDYDGIPAQEACEDYGIESQEDEEALEKATEEVYEKEFHTGTLNANCQDFAGEKVNSVKDHLVEQFENMGRFDSMYDFSEEVVSRSGGKVIVSLQNSWFIDYGNEEWKTKVRDYLDEIALIPEDTKKDFLDTVDWLESWPAIRNYGLGTPLPFDEDFIVEPLSDSTIYMAFYTISHIVDEPEKLQPIFFDYLIQDEHSAEEVAEETGMDLETIEECKRNYDYWYPLDWRTTAHPLIRNHLTFMLFHHAALFQKEDWPQGIASWGLVSLEGKKMSSSKGRVALPDEEIEKYGADSVRFFLFGSLEPWEDFNWTDEGITKYQNQLRNFYHRTCEMIESGTQRERNKLDRYTLSRLQKIISKATEGLEEFQTRKAGLASFFELNSLINNYRNRSDKMNSEVIEALISAQVRLMAPFTPHVCEELWKKLGNEGFVSEAEWPEVDEGLFDEEVEQEYTLFENIVDDVREISEIVEEFDQIKIILAEDWKRELFREMEEVIDERPEFGEAMGRLVEGREEHSETVKSYLKEYLEEPGKMPERIFSSGREIEIIEENVSYIEKEFDAEVVIEREEDSEEKKASRAEPGKPAIVME